MLVCTVLDWQWWVQSVISVKLGYATGGSVSAHMRASALLPMQNVLSVKEVSGITEAECLPVLFATISSVKMTSLSIKPAAKFWKQRHLNVFPVTGLGSIHACVVRLVFVTIMCEVRFSSRKREKSLPALNVAMKLSRQRI